jgi:hypothetical protein
MFGLQKAKNYKGLEVSILLPEEKSAIGQVTEVELSLKSAQPLWIKYVIFELINERIDKRAAKDKSTNSSNYVYRYNIEESLESTDDTDKKYKFPIRIPSHKEPSRNDRFIYIKWILKATVLSSETKDAEETYRTEFCIDEIEVL